MSKEGSHCSVVYCSQSVVYLTDIIARVFMLTGALAQLLGLKSRDFLRNQGGTLKTSAFAIIYTIENWRPLALGTNDGCWDTRPLISSLYA